MKPIYIAINIIAFIIATSIILTVPIIYAPFFILVSLYTAYNLTLFFYSFKYKYIITPKQKLIESPSVAILYMTCNDFNKQSIDSIKNLSYQNKSIYIVDDSSKPEYKEAIDNIDGVTIIRRDNREGFKAGSINNALKQITADYISICDSDELVPIDYIERSLEYFTDNSIAFVQASHYAYNKHNNWTIAMGNGIDLHWTTYQKYRNNGIVVNFLGHGAILKTSVIREVGGMPLLVSEDIALTVEIYKAGYKGVFADSVQVGEATPETYSQFKRRHKKWSMGAMEFLKKYLIKIITSKNLSVSQKEDLVLSTLSLPLSALFILFIIGTFFIPIKATIPLIALSALAILSPQLVFFKLKGIKNILKSIIINAIAFMSLLPTSLIYTIKGSISPTFLITNQKANRSHIDYIPDMTVGAGLILIGGLISPLAIVALCSPIWYKIWN